MTAYVGEIRMVGFDWAPNGWALCDGSILPIAENEVLFQLIGTTYGGDGEETFALPNLQSRVPVHMGNGPGGRTFVIGEMAGVESVTLTTQQIPVHTHPMLANTGRGTSDDPTGRVWAATGANLYSSGTPDTPMNAQMIGGVGGSQPHENLMPYVTINFIISLFGVFPSQT